MRSIFQSHAASHCCVSWWLKFWIQGKFCFMSFMRMFPVFKFSNLQIANLSNLHICKAIFDVFACCLSNERHCVLFSSFCRFSEKFENCIFKMQFCIVFQIFLNPLAKIEVNTDLYQSTIF